jgi:proliferating cell nuclear antigen
MACIMHKGKLQIEKGLAQLNWDTKKFEEELEMFAKTQSPEIQDKLRKEYNRYMNQCGWPMELIVVSEPLPKLTGPKSLPRLPAKERLPELPEIKPHAEPIVTAEATPVVESVSSQETETAPETKEAEAPIPLAVQEPDPIPQETKLNETEIKTPERKELHGYIVLPDAMQVKNLLKTLNVLVDEATFRLTPQGLSLKAMDPSRVAMIDLVIPRENCEEHSCPEEMKFCFSLERYLNKTLKNITKNDAIRLDIQTGIVDKMNTRLTSKLTRNFSMPLLEVSDEEVPTPKINFNYSARLVLENVNTLFKDLEDHVQIVGTQDGLTFQQKGDIEDFTTTLEKGDETVLNIEAKEESKATYSVSYLKEALKALNLLTGIIEVSYSTDMPVRISAELEHLGTVSIYLAPRIETE